MRISDWSSDVCSSDLAACACPRPGTRARRRGGRRRRPRRTPAPTRTPPPRSPPFPAATRWNRGNRRCRRPGTPVLLPAPRSLVTPRLVVRQGESEHAAAALARFEEQPPLVVLVDRAADRKAEIGRAHVETPVTNAH